MAEVPFPAGRVVPVGSFFGRLRGLIGRPCPPDGECWALYPASGVHTLFVAYPIAACLLDRSGRVLWVRDPMPPWRLGPVLRGAFFLLEAAPGLFSGLSPGDVVDLPEVLRRVACRPAASCRRGRA